MTAENSFISLPVELGARSYPIHIGRGLLAKADQILDRQLANRHLVIIADSQTAPLYSDQLASILRPIARRLDQIELPAGEASKSLACYGDLLDRLLAIGVDRRVVLIALGGGVIGDLVGFAAASLLRGVDFIQLPTSLLAQVDSSVGGKTGLNMASGKNLVGAFWQPRAVLADLAVLDSLPRRELLAGYAEIVKYGLLGDAGFFGWLEENGRACLELEPASLGRAVHHACRMKADIVARDETETGQRALLNLGHSFGHALEAEAGYDGRLLHGEAVAAGMVMAFDFSVRQGLCPVAAADRMRAHLASAGLPVSAADMPGQLLAPPDIHDRLLSHMMKDKKVLDGHLRLVLLRDLGDAFVADRVSVEAVHDFLADWTGKS